MLRRTVQLCSSGAPATAAALSASNPAGPLKKPRLHGLHVTRRAKMASYAGWDMPLQYEGMAQEHNHTRAACSLFDVSHMCQVRFLGTDRERFVEWATVADLHDLPPWKGRLTVLLNDEAGVIDDMIVHRCPDHVAAVLNAGRMHHDIAHFSERIASFNGDVSMEIDGSRSLLALQGPKAAEVLVRHVDGIDKLPFMACRHATIKEWPVLVSRTGYTGEDGFEIAVKHKHAETLADLLLAESEVKQAGLGARNSLRVEAGFCLYGHELDENISPFEANLMWLVTKRQRHEGNFVGRDALMRQVAEPTLKPMRRVGIKSVGLCARDHAEVLVDGKVVGHVTSGCPSPTLKCNVAQAYVHMDHAKAGTKVELVAKPGRPPVAGEVVKMPFVQIKKYTGDDKPRGPPG